MKGLALRGQDRYQSMAKFLQALKDGQKKARTPKVSDRKAVIIAAAAVGLGVAAIGAFTVIRSGTPVLTKGGVPEWLDDHTVFTEDTPLVLNGKHLKYVDAVYLNDKKVEDLEIVEQTDKELKLVFSLPEDTERLSLRLEAGSGFLKKKSSEKKIKVYETETQVPKAESLTKNGYELNREELRVNEPFTLGVNCGSDSEDYIFVNGEALPDCTYADGSVSGTVDEELIKKINEEGELRVWLSPKTKEGYAASKRSNEIVLKVNERLIDNSWTELMEGSEWGVKMIVDFDQELENEEAEIQDKIDALYEAGVRFLRYRPANGVDLTTVMEVLAGKKDMYLILDLTGDADMEKVYAAMTKKNREAVGRVIAMIDSGEALDQWVKTNKIQDSLKILFCADNMGMIFKDSLDYWKKNNIKAVSFREDSYWSSTSLRNRENVKKTGIAFFCDSPRNALEAARLLEPSTFGDGQTGVRGILSGEITPDSLYSAKNGKIDSAVLLAGSANGDGVRDYLKMAATSGYTVMAVVKDNGREIDNIAPELEQLGFSSSVLGNAQAGRYSYIGIVKTHTDGSRGDLVYEESRSPADGVPLETDYVSEVSGRSFHLKSMGRRDENDKNGPAAAVITGGENYAPNQSGINFVIYDEQTDTIIDRIWFNTWTNKDNPTPALSKSGGFEWVMFHTPKEQKEQAEKIAKYFETLASKKNEYLIIAAAADDSTRNFGSDIQKAMEEIGVTAAFDNAENFQKSYVGLFAEDLKEISVENGSNDTFSDQRLSVENLSYDGKSFHVVSEGHDIENSLAQIEIDGKEMTNGLRGLHILVYDRKKHCPVNYAWIDGYDGLRFNSIDLG